MTVNSWSRRSTLTPRGAPARNHRPVPSVATTPVYRWINRRVVLIALILLVPALALHAFGRPTAGARPLDTVIYVDGSATGDDDGTSWADAYTSLQAALDQAVSGDEMWVAAGVYTPGTERDDTFYLEDGVALYGGFTGTEGSRDERDWRANVTVLSGEIGDPETVEDNSTHVVAGVPGSGPSTRLDGVTVTGGQAIIEGYPTDRGGGMFNNEASPTVANVTFVANYASEGGGGMFNDDGSSPVLVNVAFVDNASFRGGGIHNNTLASPTLANVTFNGNRAAQGGAIYNSGDSNVVLVNTTLVNNVAEEAGAGIYNSGSSATVRNSILWGNTVDQIVNDDGATTTVEYSLVEGGYDGEGNVDADPLFLDAAGPDDNAGTADDLLRLRSDSPAVDAGNNDFVPADVADLDGDGDTDEPLPLDGSDAPRFTDVPARDDTGSGSAPVVDMGAYETAPRYYVDTSASGDGSSWTRALVSLRSALAYAVSGDEIWVSEGVYSPGESLAAAFELKDGVSLYGGFAGDETSLEERDWQVHATVLSGETGEDVKDDNNEHVVRGTGLSDAVTLDGFTITRGCCGGALYLVDSSPTLRNLIFDDNGLPLDANGGALYNLNGSPRLMSVTFTGNSAKAGGAMANVSGSPTLENVSFSGNSAVDGGGALYNRDGNMTLVNVTFSENDAPRGGALLNEEAGAALVNVTFTANEASIGGGGMYNIGGGPTLVNVLFNANEAPYGGGLYNSSSSTPSIVNSTFSGNSATTTEGGGGIHNSANSSATVRNSILWGNAGGQISSEEGSGTDVEYSLVQGGFDGEGNVAVDPRFVDADGDDDVRGTRDDDLRLQPDSPAVDAGDNSAVPADALDLDADEDTGERLPLDLDGGPRHIDSPARPDTGAGSAPVVDMGAYEANASPAANTLYLPFARR